MNNKAGSGRNRSASVVIFAFVFIICCALCAVLFAKSAVLSEKASSLNGAVQVCRNAAQVFSLSKSAEETSKILGGDGEIVFLSGDFTPADENNAVYTLKCTENKDGIMVYGEFSVFDLSGKEVYSLRTGVCETEAAQ